MNNPNDLRTLLAQHIGSDKLYEHSLVRTFTYTPGVLGGHTVTTCLPPSEY